VKADSPDQGWPDSRWAGLPPSPAYGDAPFWTNAEHFGTKGLARVKATIDGLGKEEAKT
jgi:hypothetical protein